MMKRKLIEYIDANLIFDVDENIIQDWIHKLEGDLCILRGELLRREHHISTHDWEQGRDVFDRFGLPNINTKEQH